MVQININKKTGILASIIILLLGVIIAMSVSNNDGDGPLGMNHSMMMNDDASDSIGDLTGADIMYL